VGHVRPKELLLSLNRIEIFLVITQRSSKTRDIIRVLPRCLTRVPLTAASLDLYLGFIYAPKKAPPADQSESAHLIHSANVIVFFRGRVEREISSEC